MSAISPNLLDRQFTATAANRKWIADFTYIWTAEGWLYVAAVVDLFSRRVVGWSMSATMTAQFVADALMMAMWRRGKPDAVMHHSDRGSQSEFKRSSQHLTRSYDDQMEATIGSVWASAIDFAGSASGGRARRAEKILGSYSSRLVE